MKNTPGRRTLRHVIAGLWALPFLVSVIFDSADRKGRLTEMDQATQVISNYIGDASFACTGSLAAGMEGMDLFGCIVVGFITALGGGTVRDLFLGKFPIWWLTAWDEFLLVTVVSSLTFFCWPCLSRRFHLTSSGECLFWTDALGLGVFAASGASAAAAHQADLHVVACAVCGMFTATFGGLTRDVLIGRPPRILYPMLELYALPAFLGGLSTGVALKWIDENMVMESIMLGVWVTIHLRVFCVNLDLRLPSFPADDIYSKETRPRDMAAELAMEEERRRSKSSSKILSLLGLDGY